MASTAPAYQPAHTYLQKGVSTTYSFDSPNTLQKQMQEQGQQNSQGQFLPAGGDTGLKSFDQGQSFAQGQSFSQGQNFAQGQQFQIPQAPPLPMWNFNRGSRQSSPIRLRTRDWGRRTQFGWTNFNSQNVLQESFLSQKRNIPAAPRMRPLSWRRTWTRGPYMQPRLRTHQWGNSTRKGWTNWNRNSYSRTIESTENRQAQFWRSAYLSDRQGGSDSSRGIDNQQWNSQQLGSQQLGPQQFGSQQIDSQQIGSQQFGSQQFGSQQLGSQQLGSQQLGSQQLGSQQLGSQQLGSQQLGSQQLGAQQLGSQQLGSQQFGSQQLGSQQLGNQQYSQQYGNTTVLPAIISNGPMPTTAPIVAPIAGNNLQGNAKGRKGRRQRNKALKQAAIGQQLNTRFAPPIGDPAVNAYRGGANAPVPLAGPAPAGQPTGKSLFSRRKGMRNNLGPRRARRGRTMPVPAVQPPIVAPVAVPTTTNSYSQSFSQPLNSSYGGGQSYGSNLGGSNIGGQSFSRQGYANNSGISPAYSAGIQQQQFAGQRQY